MSHLLQIKVNESFLDKLNRISESFNLSRSAFIKMTLATKMQQIEHNELTENGFTKDEEDKIVLSISQTNKERKMKKIKKENIDNFLQSL